MLRKTQFAVTQRVQHHFTHGQAHVPALFHSFRGHVFEHFIWIDRLLDLVLFPRLWIIASLPHCMCWPPLMAILAPVTNAASSEHK
jgi:hypothetical protein